MKTFLKSITLLLALLASLTPRATATTITTSWMGSMAIPDNNASGLAFSFNLNTPTPASIYGLTVDLTIAGGWNGDLYAYLSHGSSFCVLLNRVGRTAGNPDGSGVSGMTVELSDSYLTDIHNFAGNPLSGNFAPDGRNVNPLNALDTDPRAAMLDSFINTDPNGAWTLFFADLAPGGVSTVRSWSVNVSVPDSGNTAALMLESLALLGLTRRLCIAARSDKTPPQNPSR
jgi:hypothetical protein